MNAADDVGAEVDVDVEEPAELLLDPLEPDLAVAPEQWEVVADDPEPPLVAPQSVPDSVPDAPDRGAGTEEEPEKAEFEAPPVAVPVLRHIVEAPVFDPAPMPEPEPEPEEEPDFEVFAPVTAPVSAPVFEPVAPTPARAAAAATRAPAPFVADQVPPAERATSAMVLVLLAVVVGIALAGLVSAVVLVLTVLIRRALGA